MKQKKYRDKHKLFFVEGDKIVKEVIGSSYHITGVYATRSWIDKNPGITAIEVNDKQMNQISLQSAPNGVLALVDMPVPGEIPRQLSGLTLCLDGISDPGNLGTIIRISDWFAVDHILCSNNCVDMYNPKVMQSSMGSFVRVKLLYTDLPGFIASQNDKFPIYAMAMEGQPIYKNELKKNSMVIIGNESYGISQAVMQKRVIKIGIPAYGKAESLNAGIAAGIACSEYKRVN